jgi:hypothetical protein
MNKINVLVFPAGEINSVELNDSLATCVNIKLFGASSIDKHGEYVFKNYLSDVPMINEKCFIDEFNKLLAKNNINVIFPTHDTVAEFFAENLDRINAKVIVADKKTAEICRDKEKTFNLFKGEDFCPEIYSEIKQYPVFIKPRKGQGSVGTKIIKDSNNVPTDMDLNDYVIVEYLPNEEYTVDCLTDKDGILKCVFPRSRKRTLAGVCVAGKNEELTDEIKSIAERINDRLNFFGLWFFQIKKDRNNKFKLMEISTRCSGTMGLTRALGINLPLLSVYTAMGYDIEIFGNNYNVTIDRTLITRYKTDIEYDFVYIDFDDTILIDDQINFNAIRFLYQCKNTGKKVILLTKHIYRIRETLEKHAISDKLFFKIVQIANNENKSNYIASQKEKAIFIDNAFQERKMVHNKCMIPVFDVDGIEVMLDWRR